MTAQRMRTIDRFLGIPLCWLVGTFCRLTSRSGIALQLSDVREILVIKFFGMGSILLATPSLAMMKASCPNARITFLSFSRNSELLRRLSSVDEVLAIRTESLRSFTADTFRAIAHLLRRRYDIVFDLEFFSKFSTLLSGASRAPIRAAFELPTTWRSLVVTHATRLSKDRNVAASFCGLVRQVTGGILSGSPALETLRITESDRQSLLEKLPISGKKIIAINVNAGDTFLERRWPADRFSRLVSLLARQEDATFCFTGAGDEREYVQTAIVQTTCPDRCINAAGLLTIPELGALLELSDLLISSDSGPLHLAASLKTPTISLYGPESPTFYGPLGDHHAVIYKGIACSPCMNVYSAKDFRCPYDARCMKDIRVEEVFEHATASLQVYA